MAAPPAQATERLFEHWTEAQGLPINTVHSIEQDRSGAIWLSTIVGAVRYDGHTFEALEPPGSTPARRIAFVDGETWVLPLGRENPLRKLGGEPIPGPDGEPILDARAFVEFDDAVWVSSDSWVLRRDADGWNDVLDTDGKVRDLVVDGDTLLAASASGLWQLHPGPPRIVVEHDGISRVLRFQGRLLGLDLYGNLVDLDAGQTLASDLGFPESMAIRGDTLWATFDQTLLSVDAAGEVRTHPMPELDGVAHLQVDREGSLWLGGSRGVVRFPEPDTVNWAVEDGLPYAPIDQIVVHGEQMWLLTRSELVPFEAGRLGATGGTHKATGVCRDRDGTVWAGGNQPKPFFGVLTANPGPDEVRHPIGERTSPGGCAATEQGVLFSAGRDLWLAGDPIAKVGEGPEERMEGTIPALDLAPDGQLQWLEDTRLCTAPPHPFPQSGDWSCTEIPARFWKIVTSEHGRWAYTRGAVYAWSDGAWKPLETSLDLAGVEGLAASPRGGVWVLGIGLFARVVDGQVVERIGSNHGLTDRSPLSVHEDPDGTLWVGTRSGLSRIPASARNRGHLVPSVVLAALTSDDQELSASDDIVLPWDRNRLNLRVSALSYRDPEALRYRLIANGNEQIASDGTFRFLDLAAGRYEVAIAASSDGVNWSPEPIELSFRVLRPPWLQWWAILGYLATILGIAAAVYRSRVNYLLGLERQRARIALDLHDEVGSGLGSIGLIAGALPMLDDPEKAAETIANTSAELGEALTEIVWALKADSDRVEAVLEFLEQRGQSLFADPGVRFEVVRPDPLPRTRLSLPVRRSVTAIALEAMHNAAKYAQASNVTVSLKAGRTWTLTVTDDGKGIDPGAPIRPGGGSGMENMQTRADTIGAELTVQSSEEGTTVGVRFDPSATDRRIR